MTLLKENKLSVVKVENCPIDVNKTFDCGQCFRFEKIENSKFEQEYSGVAHGRFVSFAKDGPDLYIINADEKDYNSLWKTYLGLDTDYGGIDRDILSRSANPALREALAVGSGIRILHQEAWETVCSFIISQNNNIPRIKKIVSSLCREYGKAVRTDGMTLHGAKQDGEYSFPDADTVALTGIDGMLALKTGFRAKYINDAATKCSDGSISLSTLGTLPTQELRECLKSIKGIGEKVACCAMLFGFGRLDAFPVDVWIKRVIAKYFDADFTPEQLGPYAGVAQQYLFYYEKWLGGQAEKEA